MSEIDKLRSQCVNNPSMFNILKERQLHMDYRLDDLFDMFLKYCDEKDKPKTVINFRNYARTFLPDLTNKVSVDYTKSGFEQKGSDKLHNDMGLSDEDYLLYTQYARMIQTPKDQAFYMPIYFPTEVPRDIMKKMPALEKCAREALKRRKPNYTEKDFEALWNSSSKLEKAKAIYERVQNQTKGKRWHQDFITPKEGKPKASMATVLSGKTPYENPYD